MNPVILNLASVTRCFQPDQVVAVDGVELTLAQGELLALLGPSGCGKTTLLRLIAGLERPDGGRIDIGGRSVAGEGNWVPPEGRRLGMVFQDYALFPHLSVAENIGFGLKRSRRKSAGLRDRVGKSLDLVRLTGLDKRYPHELSGGQQQRVALARALAPDPALVLLDEPLSNLDVQVRQQLREEVRSILKASGASGIFVTHDCEEALAIADQVAVMRQGRIEQLAPPEELYWRPTSQFVAAFVVQMNFIPSRDRGDHWETPLGAFTGKVDRMPGADGNEVLLGVRQSHIQVRAAGGDRPANGQVLGREFLGGEYRYTLQLQGPAATDGATDGATSGVSSLLQARVPLGDRQVPQDKFETGDRVYLSLGPQLLQAFPLDPS